LDPGFGGRIQYWNVEASNLLANGDTHRDGVPVPVRPRLGQGLFSFAVRDAYRGACAVTQEHTVPVLEAAHIVPYSQGGKHNIGNGLFLRRDLHSLFDRGYVTVTPDYIFQVGNSLRDEYHNGRSYYSLDRHPISVPEPTGWKPNREYLEWHGKEIFKG
jgi:putative restriction endonuclease